MPYYESVFIARQDVSSTQVEQLGDQFAEVVAGLGGEVKKREYWGLRNLAYKVNKNRKGHYVLFNLDAPSEAVTEMERLMRLNEDVMSARSLRPRFIHTRRVAQSRRATASRQTIHS